MVRRIAFLSGLILGSGICAWALGSALIYLSTGKFPSVQVGGEGRFRLELTDVRSMYEAPVVAPAPSGVVQDMEGV